ncbi:hypothetical protein [Pseudoduganella sp.]|uniref:hypothetical protein n=1 Tax=Pseudoduganella sp. TaxID=1880898 RepID=UPI0035AE0FA9
MQKLNTELKRLYLAEPEAEAAGLTRAISLAFRRLPDDAEDGHWERLCVVANALQTALALPAPAVSISGDGAYGLWLSLAQPVPLAQAREFAGLLWDAYCPALKPAAVGAAPASASTLPPRLDPASGKWAAFINPGMGASFAGDEGLEIQPPEAGQLTLLERLECIAPEQFARALDQLRPAGAAASQAAGAAPQPSAAQDGLLLRDATLEDIVNFLHSKNIEPTFRFLK